MAAYASIGFGAVIGADEGFGAGTGADEGFGAGVVVALAASTVYGAPYEADPVVTALAGATAIGAGAGAPYAPAGMALTDTRHEVMATTMNDLANMDVCMNGLL